MRALKFITGILVLGFIALHPTQLTVQMIARLLEEHYGLGVSLKFLRHAHVTVADLLLAAAFGFWLLQMLLQRRWRDIRAVSLPTGALVLVAILSALPFLKGNPLGVPQVVERFRAVKDILQLVLYFVCGVLLLSEFFKRPAWSRWSLHILLAAGTVVILLGFYEFLWLRPPEADLQAGYFISPMKVDATFGMAGIASGAHEAVGTRSNRNVLGAWLTLILPLLYGVYLGSRSPGIRYWAFALFWFGLALLLAGGLWLAALFGILLMCFIHGRRTFLLTGGAIALFFGLLFWFAPQRPADILLDSMLLYKQVDRYKTLPLYDNKDAYPNLYQSPEGAELQDDERFWPWQQKFVEWQPGLIMLRWNPVFGVGIGNYQKNIGLYYINPGIYYNFAGPNEKPRANLMEPDAIAFYLVWTAEVGLLGLFAWLWLVADYVHRGIRNFRFMDTGTSRGLVLGAVGALVALVVGSFFTNYLVRGVMPALIIVVAFARTGEFLAMDPRMFRAGEATLEPDSAGEQPGATTDEQREKKD